MIFDKPAFKRKTEKERENFMREIKKESQKLYVHGYRIFFSMLTIIKDFYSKKIVTDI